MKNSLLQPLFDQKKKQASKNEYEDTKDSFFEKYVTNSRLENNVDALTNKTVMRKAGSSFSTL